jgi:DNA-directed RNA polymerase subunit H (RpoH/RPB5)
MRKRMIQYAILWHPNEDQAKAGQTSKFLVETTTVLAKDEKEVAVIAAKKIEDKFLDQLEQIDIVVRPF